MPCSKDPFGLPRFSTCRCLPGPFHTNPIIWGFPSPWLPTLRGQAWTYSYLVPSTDPANTSPRFWLPGCWITQQAITLSANERTTPVLWAFCEVRRDAKQWLGACGWVLLRASQRRARGIAAPEGPALVTIGSTLAKPSSGEDPAAPTQGPGCRIP